MQQPPDERALAIIHAAAGDETQQVGAFMAAQEIGQREFGVGKQRHQK